MKIHTIIPFSPEKNLGKAYNEEIALIPDNDWALLLDHDVLMLTPDTINHLYKYVELFPDTGIFTCLTNRLHPLGKNQLLGGVVSEDFDVRNHALLAIEQKKKLYEVTDLNKHISGFFMLIAKNTWNEIKFDEDKLCLGIDNNFSDRVLNAGKKIRRMDGILVFHSYRMVNGIKNKEHLL